MHNFKLTVAVLTIIFPYLLFNNSYDQPAYVNMSNTNNDIEIFIGQVESAFDKAESEVFGLNVKPEPIILPDPDPKKCVCKGSGIIIHGDGHTTECPFHPSKTFIKKLNTGEIK